MSDERTDPGSDAESVRIEEAQRRIDEAAAAAAAAKDGDRQGSAPSKPTWRRRS